MLLLPQFELATFLLIGATCAFVEITCALFPLKPSIDCWYVLFCAVHLIISLGSKQVFLYILLYLFVFACLLYMEAC